jgi:hypothetical protein
MEAAEPNNLIAQSCQLAAVLQAHTDALMVLALPASGAAPFKALLALQVSTCALMVSAEPTLAQPSMVAHSASHSNAAMDTALVPLLNALVTPTALLPLHSDAPTTSVSLT